MIIFGRLPQVHPAVLNDRMVRCSQEAQWRCKLQVMKSTKELLRNRDLNADS